MDTNETVAPVGPEPLPTHEAGPWNVHRETLIHHSHEVAGVRYIGGAGQRLEEVLRATWVNETRQLVTDLKIAFTYLPDEVLRYAVSQVNQAAETTLALRGSTVEGVRAETGEHDEVDLGSTVEGGRQLRARRRDAAAALDAERAADEGVVA